VTSSAPTISKGITILVMRAVMVGSFSKKEA
jgi:hypothetical protein